MLHLILYKYPKIFECIVFSYQIFFTCIYIFQIFVNITHIQYITCIYNTYRQYMVQNDAKNRKILDVCFHSYLSTPIHFVLSTLYRCFYITLQKYILVFVHIHTSLLCTIITSYIPMNFSFNELCTALRFAPSVL